MIPMMSEQTAKGYLDNRRDTLRRQIREFIASLYAEFQSLLIDYKKVKAFLEGF